MDIPPEPRSLEQPDPPRSVVQAATLTFKRSTFFAALLPIAFVLGLAAGFVFWGLPQAAADRARNQGAAVADAQPTPAVTAGTTQPPNRYDVPVDDDPALGPADAPITLIEFSDYECPYCRKWYTEVWPKLKAEYQGKIRFVYRDFPLDGLHPNAVSSAEAANCANEQGKYWEFHDLLFSAEGGLGLAAYEKDATDLKLDLPKFKECVSSRRFKDEVQKDYQFAADLGIRSTPTFFINGLALVGAQPYEVFKQVIDKELAGAIPR